MESSVVTDTDNNMAKKNPSSVLTKFKAMLETKTFPLNEQGEKCLQTWTSDGKTLLMPVKDYLEKAKEERKFCAEDEEDKGVLEYLGYVKNEKARSKSKKNKKK